MDQDQDRTSRSQRHRGNADDELYNDQLPAGTQDAAPSRRRRRSQASRIQADDGLAMSPSRDTESSYRQSTASYRDQAPAYDEEPSREYRREQRSAYERDPYEPEDPQNRRFARPVAEQPPRKARSSYDDDLYDDDPYREEDPYRRKESARDVARARDRDRDRETTTGRNARGKRVEPDDYEDPYYDDYEDEEEPPRKKHVLRWVIILVVILALLGGVTYVGMNNPDLVQPIVQWGRDLISGATPTPEPTVEPTPEPTATPEPEPDISAARVISFVADPADQPDLNLPITFQVTTTSQTDRVQIVDDNGVVLIEGHDGEYTESEFGRVWPLMVYFLTPYDGVVEAYPGNVSGWNEASGSQISVKVGDTSSLSGADGGASGATTMLSDAGFVAVATETESYAFDKNGELPDYSRANPVDMAGASGYQGENGMNGVLTFRGSAMRQNAAFGKASATEMKLQEVWTAEAGIPNEGDSGFGAQPIIVQWHANIREMMALNASKISKNKLKEVIFASNTGSIYFYDLDDGQVTRDPLQIDPVMPMVGTASVYPKGLPILFVGSGDPTDTMPEGDTGLLVYDLIKNTKIGILKGVNADALSKDTSFNTSPVLDNNSDTILGVGGNGLLYTMRLNSSIDGEEKVLKVTSPTVEILRIGKEGEDTRVDSSLAVYGQYAYYATNGGLLVCVDVNTLSVVWALSVGADTDASVALEEAESGAVLYLATKSDVEGLAHMRRINAATGKVEWDVSVPGSITASPLVGMGPLAGQVFFAARNSEAGGTIYALNSNNGGALLWEYVLVGTKLASPIAMYSDAGSAWIVQGDDGGLLLLDALTGERLDYLALDGAVYGSPAAFDNMIVVATETGKLHGVQLQ